MATPSERDVEYKTIVWNVQQISFSRGGASFVEVMESEGISEDKMSDCSYPERYTSSGGDDWSIVSTSQRACVLTIVVDKLAKENWSRNTKITSSKRSVHHRTHYI
ncbi:unnamed protein product [Bathycoccus prasinos]